MPIFHAIVLGLVQGLSEFLPISSSGHLELVPWLFDWHDFDDEGTQKAFDVALHLGTLVAAVVYLRADVARYIGAGVRLVVKRQSPASVDGRVAWLLLLSTIPAAAIGALFEDTIDEHLGTPTIIAVSLIGFGLLLGVVDRALGRREVEGFSTRDAVIVGAAQALALNPGTSRSGITMTAARSVGFSRDAAARLSFLMMIPVTAGAVVFKLAGLVADDGIPSDLRVPMLVGILTSGVSGWFAVWGLLRIVRTRTFTPFVVYRVALGIVVLVIVAAGWR
ncbi:undecaprenyl-diphosphate phosphatase [Desertimonas flava]|uniref:undecaprenyl-diphosphate phosphatase n=1 Tax=Desertimonas flava TaxID=2064846 RepID=UPI000E35404E|nr:undecaprenyl-diphosphate phosphatase [Desertimonas flava]